MVFTGIGIDTHRLVPERKLVLGGIEIPYEKGLLGHSDADILTHAVMDALLGAASFPDIGTLFPPSDPAFKDIRSTLLLEQVVLKLKNCGYTIVNVDAVVVCEKPKLLPFIPAIKDLLGSLLDCSRVGIKATTTEGTGAEGEGLAISAHAAVLISQGE